MKYAHILMAMASEVWAMDPAKLMAVIEFLAEQAAGMKYTAQEIEAKISPASAAAVARREGTVAIVPIRGVIANRVSLLGDISGGTSSEALQKSLKALRDDSGVKTVILDVDTPGGTVAGTEELAAVVASFRGVKPIVAQVNADCASAGYWVVSTAEEIVVTPTGRVGSIGVMTAHDDISAALEQAGVKRTVITSSEYKGEALGHQPLSDEARAFLQEQVDAYDALFVNRVAAGRGVAAAAVRANFGKGRMVIASLAVKAGMADRVATMDETLARFGVNPVQSRESTPSDRRFPAAREKRRLQLHD